MSEPGYDTPSSHSAFSWSSEHSHPLSEMQNLDLVGSPDGPFINSPTSSQGTDFGSMGSAGLNFADEEFSDWFRTAAESNEPPAFDLNGDFSLGFFVPPPEDMQTPESLGIPSSVGFPYSLDPSGRRGSSFF